MVYTYHPIILSTPRNKLNLNNRIVLVCFTSTNEDDHYGLMAVKCLVKYNISSVVEYLLSSSGKMSAILYLAVLAPSRSPAVLKSLINSTCVS